MSHSSHAQWALDLIVEIDRHATGVCGEFFRASAERRQVIAAHLAARTLHEAEMAEVGRFLLAADHRSILVAAHGEHIQRLRGALRRAGPVVHGRPFYDLLPRLTSDKESAVCLARMATLNLAKLKIIDILPNAIRRANVVEAIGDEDTAHDVVSAFNLMISRGADEDEFAAALREVQGKRGLAKVFQRFVLRCRARQHPVGATDSYRPIQSAEELHKIARRFRNCARTYTIDLLDEDSGTAFAEATHEGEGVIVQLQREGDVWRLDGLYGRCNKQPSSAAREHIEAFLSTNGVDVEKRKRVQSKWDAVRQFTDRAFMDFVMW